MGVTSGETESSKTEEALLRAEFTAEDELIEINPMVRTALITLIRGSYGPFEPSITSVVPLWLALSLKKVHRCKILPPNWLRPGAVEELVADERREEGELQKIPFHFFEVSSLLLAQAADDVEDPPRLRRATEDLGNVRSAKMRRWMQSAVRDRVNAIKLLNLSLHEIQLHRPVLTRVLDDLYRIHVPGIGATQIGSQVTSSGGTASASATPGSETPVAPPRRTLRRVIRRT